MTSGYQPTNHSCRIVLTGGPGGGKTTAADLLRREIGDEIVIVPEAATMLFRGGFPRSHEPHAKRAAQRAIFHVQRNLEDVYSWLYSDRILLCDRGTVDSSVYWPQIDGDFFTSVGTTVTQELNRYSSVIFFESAAVGGLDIEGGNPVRTEDIAEAQELDRKLHGVWSQHPNFYYLPHQKSFFQKLDTALKIMQKIINGRGAA
ncbi:MAG: AAA family ATPase [Pseudobdellovibrionaceae bacterium]|nr:MAG: AAA family ATPase [Pseudobdellovibrionaceae bacterium]